MTRARLPRHLSVRTGWSRVALGGAALLVAVPLSPVAAASASVPTPPAAMRVDLGSAASFSVLGGTGVANTGPATVLALDLGLSPTGTITGLPPGQVTGTTHDKDAVAEVAQSDRADAYAAAAAQTGGTAFAGDQGGVTFHPGLYTSAAALTNTGVMTLDADGDPNAVFVFQIGAALSSAAGSKVVLTDGALANNVYWQVLGAVSLGAGSKYVGTFLGASSVAFGEGASLKGRVLTPSTVALANSPITQPIDDLTAPVVSIDGGDVRSTNDTTPSITGTTDEPAGQGVRVTVAGQTLTTTVATGGAWTVGPATLPPGPHQVDATVTDPSQNVGTDSQVLTIDVTAPSVTIDGGESSATNDTSPTISGTVDELGSPIVTVSVGGQTLTTTATAEGSWSVQTATLTETAHSVTASVEDTAHNPGTAQQVLTVDVTVPVLAIDGGASRSTVDTSPWIYGTTAERAGTTVSISVGGQALTATVLPGGTWGVSATTLPSGAHQVVATITDAAGNTGSATQLLTIGLTTPTGDVTAPALSIDGGGTRSTTDPTPTISGTSDETGGTVKVTVGGQTMLATVSPAGVWGVGAAALSSGPHLVIASISDAAQNSRSTMQEITIGQVAGPGDPPESYKPDAAIRRVGSGWVGVGIVGGSDQQATQRLGRNDHSTTFKVRLTNTGTSVDAMEVRGTPKNRKFSVTYAVGGRDVTSAVVSGRYRSPRMEHGESVIVVVKVSLTRRARVGNARTLELSAVSAHQQSAADVVSAVVRVRR